jgi:ribonucleotide reductase alpha subunit
MLPGETSPQHAFARASAAFADDEAHAQRLYDYVSKGWFMFATPLLSNGGTDRGLPISCFLSTAEDSREGIFDHWTETGWLSSVGGGVGGYWPLRSNGKKTSKGSSSTGMIPFIAVMDRLILSVSQGGTRRGSYAAYCDIDHPEIEEFITMRKPTGGDANRKGTNIHNAVNITDEFMRAVRDDADFHLRDPKTREVTKTLRARELWRLIIDTRMQTGEPYCHFIDTSNRGLPESQKKKGLRVNQSNLCVAPGTELLTDKGYRPIAALANQPANVWNGERFSPVTVEHTGENMEMVRVWFEDGSHLDCTPYHKFYDQKGVEYRAADLKAGTAPGAGRAPGDHRPHRRDLRPGDRLRGRLGDLHGVRGQEPPRRLRGGRRRRHADQAAAHPLGGLPGRRRGRLHPLRAPLDPRRPRADALDAGVTFRVVRRRHGRGRRVGGPGRRGHVPLRRHADEDMVKRDASGGPGVGDDAAHPRHRHRLGLHARHLRRRAPRAPGLHPAPRRRPDGGALARPDRGRRPSAALAFGHLLLLRDRPRARHLQRHADRQLHRDHAGDRPRRHRPEAHGRLLPLQRQRRDLRRVEGSPDLHRRPHADARQHPPGVHRHRAPGTGLRRLQRHPGALCGPGRAGLPLRAPGPDDPVRERSRPQLQPRAVPAGPRGSRRGFDRARVRARRGAGHGRHRRALRPQDRDRAERVVSRSCAATPRPRSSRAAPTPISPRRCPGRSR